MQPIPFHPVHHLPRVPSSPTSYPSPSPCAALQITCVPLENGVLEFGTVTKDKRETTSGSEYQEVTRPYRRTVFMHDDWVDHRSTDRFFRSMTSILESGVLRARNKEVTYAVAFSLFLCFYNALAGGYTDFDNVKHAAVIQHLPVLSVPLSMFSLTAPSLGLLLVFKTNAAYGRWDNARRVWGDIINKCRSLVRQGNTFFVEDRYPGYGNFRDYRRRVAAETSAFTRCLRCFLRGKEDEKNLQIELKDLGFTPSEVAGYMKAANKQVYALQKIGGVPGARATSWPTASPPLPQQPHPPFQQQRHPYACGLFPSLPPQQRRHPCARGMRAFHLRYAHAACLVSRSCRRSGSTV